MEMTKCLYAGNVQSHTKAKRGLIGILNVLITLLSHPEPVTKLPRSDRKVFLNPSMPLPNCGCQWTRKMFDKHRWIISAII